MTTPDAAEWGVLLKCRVLGEEPTPSDASLERVLARLPGPDKRLTGGGRDFTTWSWFEAHDAASAVATAAATLRSAAATEGIRSLQVIRAHAASVEGRSSPFRGIVERLGRTDEWTVYFRAAAPIGGAAVGSEVLVRVAAALGKHDVAVSFGGDREKFLLDDGRGMVIRFWVAGPDPAEAFRVARRDALAALAAVGLGDWSLVRMQAATAEARHGDTFPGARDRQPRVTEETR